MTSRFESSAHVGGLITLTARLMQQVVSMALVDHGLTFAQATVLVRLWRRGGSMPQTDLIESLVVSRASGTLLLNELEAKGMLARIPDTSDRRRFVVELTKKGAELEQPVWDVFDSAEKRLIDGIPADAAAELYSVLRVVLDNASSTWRTRDL